MCGLRISRRELLRAGAYAAGGVALAACAPTATTTPAAGAAPAGGAAAEPVTLRIISGSSGSSSFEFNCLVAGSDLQSWIPFMYVPPMYFDADLNLRQGVFASYSSNEDKTVWTLKIDPRAKFSDGSPVTANDFKVSWETQCAPVNEVSRAKAYHGNVVGFDKARENPDGGPIDGFKVVDDATLEVTLTKPDPIYHWRVATCHLVAVKAEQMQKYTWDTYWLPENSPVFSGPFMLTAYDPDLKTAELVKNPNWWMDEGPYVDKVTFQFVTDQQTVGAMFLNGQADACLTPLPATMEAQLPDMFRPTKTFGFNVFWLRVAAEPTSDPKVREALALSVDWSEVQKAAFPTGHAVPTTQIIDPDLPCKDTEHTWYKYDVEAAKAALAASTYGGVEKLPKLRVTPRGSAEVTNRALEAAMGFWRTNLGIENIEFKQSPDEFGEEDVKKLNLSRDDVTIRLPDSATYMWTAAHSSGPVADPTGDLLNGYKNVLLEEALDEALLLDAEDPKRCELALQAQELFMNDYVVLTYGKEVIPLCAREYVKNYMKGPDVGVIEPWRIKIEK